MTSAVHARAALALLIAGVASTLVLMTLPVFVGAIANAFGFGAREAGWIASADMAGSAIASLCFIPLIARVRWKRVAYLSIGIALVANVLSMVATTLPAMLGARLLAGAGGGLMLSLAFVGLCRSTDPDRYFGIYVFLQLALQALALIGFPILLASFGLDAVFLGLATVAVACAALVPAFPERMPLQVASGSAPTGPRVYVSAGAAVALAAQATYFLAPGAVWGYLERIGQAFSLSLPQVSYALSASTLAGIAGALLVVALGSKAPRNLALVVGSLLSIAATALLIDGSGASRYLVATSLFNFAWNATFPYQMGVLASLDRTGAVAILALLAQVGGLALGPLLASMLDPEGGYTTILLACIGCYVASLFGFLLSVRTR